MDRIPIAGPWITRKEIDYVSDAVTRAWYSEANVYNDRFERAFADYVGRTHAISLPSCTSAIHLALAAFGVQPGDEVVVPDVTWIASAAPISYVGATPVFADVDERTWCLSAESFEECITPRTRAVIPVDLYGGMPDMDSILEVARRHGILVIEDAAEAIGSEYRGVRAGGFGDASVFSFHGSKTLTTGEGGMLVTDDGELHGRVQFLRDHGRTPGDRMFFNSEVAYKYKMTNMQAALGLAQLERVDELIDRKRSVFSWYEAELGTSDGVVLNQGGSDAENVYWMTTAVVDPDFGMTKTELMARMDDRGIDCRPFFSPLSSLPAYRDTDQASAACERNTVAYRVSPYGLNLPSGLNMTAETVGYVCEAFRAALGVVRSPNQGGTIGASVLRRSNS
jgi:perosamine synthetase